MRHDSDRSPRDPQAPSRRPLQRGQALELEITSMALDGDALGTVDDYVVLVPGAIPGERVLVQVTSATRKFARARVQKILRPSPHRVAPRCRHFDACGGCTWQHIAYPEQLRLKSEMLSSLLSRALGRSPGGWTVEVQPTLGIAGDPVESASPAPWGFRNKVHFVLGRGQSQRGIVMGHYRARSKDLIDVKECPVHAERGNAIAFRVREIFKKHGVMGTDEETLRGDARHLIVRVGEHTGESLLTIVAVDSRSPALKHALEEIAHWEDVADGVHLNLHDRPGPFLFGRETRKIHGRDRLRDEVAGVHFLVSPKAFFQTSIRSAERLVETVLRFVPQDPGAAVLDLYAGAGLFSLPVALGGRRVLAVEENPVAVQDGLASLRRNGIAEDACRFVRSRVEDALRQMSGEPQAERPRFAAVVLDPPREGCPAQVLAFLLRKLRPERIVYVSCNPRALAADLAAAVEKGYRIAEIQPVDMFPHTAHIESVALMERPGKGAVG